MNTQTVAAITAAVALAAANQAGAQTEGNAYGQTDGVLACDLTESGLRVSASQSKAGRIGGLDVQPGDACLPALADLPPAFVGTPLFASFGNGGSSGGTTLPDCLIWILDAGNVTDSVLACDPDENGDLRAALLDSGAGNGLLPGAVGELCMETLSQLEGMGVRSGRPIAAALGRTQETQAVLLFTARLGRFYSAVQCALDEMTHTLVTVAHENSVDGPVEVAPGERCVDTLAGLRALGLQVSDPIPARRGGSQTTDPGCLIWIIQGGTILE